MPNLRFIRIASLILANLFFAVGINGVSASDKPSLQQFAQINLDFIVCLNDRQVVELMQRRGYTEIRIVNRKMTRVRLQACRNGELLEVDVAPNGKIKRQQRRGVCADGFTIEQARAVLERNGFNGVSLDPVRNGYQGVGCRQGTRISVFVDTRGNYRELQVIGRCFQGTSKKEIRANLRQQGYSRIRFEDYPPPPYLITACRDQERLEIVVSADGRIWRQNRIGTCEPELTVQQVPEFLRQLGYNRIDIKKGEPPFVVEACKGRERFALQIGRYRKIQKEAQIGSCARRLKPQALTRKLGKEGYSRIEIREQSDYSQITFF